MANIILPLKPVMSEKAYGLSSAGVYMFEVPKNAGKLEVKQAVESQYGVGVTAVRSTNRRGKARKVWRKRGRSITGRQPDVKRAYITLKEGDKLPIFESMEEHDHKHEPTPKKVAKKEAK